MYVCVCVCVCVCLCECVCLPSSEHFLNFLKNLPIRIDPVRAREGDQGPVGGNCGRGQDPPGQACTGLLFVAEIIL